MEILWVSAIIDVAKVGKVARMLEKRDSSECETIGTDETWTRFYRRT
jgi:stage V sporulation protein SpoVS